MTKTLPIVTRHVVVGCLVVCGSIATLAGPSGRGAHRGRARITAAEAVLARQRQIALRRRLHHVHERIHAVRVKIHAAKARENHLSDSIGTVRARLQASRRQLEAVNLKLHILGRQHDLAVDRLSQVTVRLAQRRDLLKLRIRDNYLHGQVSYAQVLLEAASVHEMLTRAVYVRQVIRSDSELIAGVRHDLAQVTAEKRTLEEQAARQRALASEFESEKSRYAEDLARERALLRQTQAVRVQAEQELDESESDAAEMTDRIQSLSMILERRRQAELEDRRRAAQSSSGGSHTDSGDTHETAAPVWHGRFVRPAVGPITSTFGYRYHPILHRRRLHSGVDIGAGYGSPIRAAGTGTVILAGFVQGYGNCVIVDHGGATVTLYGHCSSLLVSEGQNVTQGQVIARVGATGMATGPHLHFELRRNGVPVSPL